jgi:multiple sugar transport system substrate-binding protein
VRKTRRAESRVRRAGAAAAAMALLGPLAACGGDEGGTPTINLYYAPEQNLQKVVDDCNAEAAGRYRIDYQVLPRGADDQRVQMVRRLAAEDESMDILGLDVTWTQEFASADWVLEWTGEHKAEVERGTLAGPLESATYEAKLYAAPNNTNVQLLWYRKDLVPTPPETWDEMIEMAKKLKPGEGNILEQGNKYEGYVVWFNNLVQSAGGEIVDAEGQPKLNEGTTKALEIIRKVATSGRADASLSTATEDPVRLTFEAGNGAFMLNWPYVYASARDAAEAGNPTAKKVFENMAWARFPGVTKGEPSKVSIGGANIGVSNQGKDPALATQAALCMTSAKWQAQEAINEALPPVMNSTYDDPKVREQYPFADELRETLADSVTRPATPSYADVTLAIQDAIHPPAEVDPKASFDKLKSNLEVVADGGMY